MRNQIIAIAAIAVIACMGLASASHAKPTGQFATFNDCPMAHQGAYLIGQFTVGTGCYIGTQTQPIQCLDAVGLIGLLVLVLGGVPLTEFKGKEIGRRVKVIFNKQMNKPIRSNSKTIFENWFALWRLKNLKILRPGGSSYAQAMFYPCRAGDEC